jgi:hypothetical protein
VCWTHFIMCCLPPNCVAPAINVSHFSLVPYTLYIESSLKLSTESLLYHKHGIYTSCTQENARCMSSNILECNLKSMMVNIFIYIECLKLV